MPEQPYDDATIREGSTQSFRRSREGGPRDLPIRFSLSMSRAFRLLFVLCALLALAFLIPGCAAPQTPAPVVTSAWETHTGQLMYRAKGGRSIIGDFVVRQSKGEGFVLNFSSGPGIPLLKLQKTADHASAEGVLARGGWRGRPASAPSHLRGWIATEEVFAQLPAGSGRLSGNGWTALVRRAAGRVENVDVSIAASGEQFVFHFAR